MKRNTYIIPAIKVKKIRIPAILQVSTGSTVNDSQGYSDQDGGYGKRGFFNLDAPLPTSSDYSGDSNDKSGY